MRKASRYVPAIGPDDVVRARVGVRAQALDREEADLQRSGAASKGVAQNRA